MSVNSVIIAVPEEELIVSLYHDYLVRHEITNYTLNDTKFNVKAFSDYIQQYLIDRYNLDSNIYDTELNRGVRMGDDGGNYTDEITAWQPLPEPNQKGGE